MAKGKLTPTKAEVVRLVKEGNTAVAWLTAKGAVVHVPTQPAALIAGVTATFFEGTPVVVISGICGLELPWTQNGMVKIYSQVPTPSASERTTRTGTPTMTYGRS